MVRLACSLRSLATVCALTLLPAPCLLAQDAPAPADATTQPADAPKVDAPKVDTPKVDTPPVEQPKTDTTTQPADAPKVDAPKVDAPKVDAPNAVVASSLAKPAEDFIHYCNIARPDLAASEGQKLVAAVPEDSKEKCMELLDVFEAQLKKREMSVQQFFFRVAKNEPVKEVANQLHKRVNLGEYHRRENAEFVEKQIQRLGVNSRAFDMAVERLKDSGEAAIPLMIAYLQNGNQKSLHMPILEAMQKMGKGALNPLVFATYMKDQDTLMMIVSTLGHLRFDAAVPYLVRAYNDKSTTLAVKRAIEKACLEIGAGDPGKLSAAQLFYDLAEKLYAERCALEPNSVVGSLWTWEEGRGLSRKTVPPAIFHEHMCMRACKAVLQEDDKRSDAVSLWIAANYRREVEVGAGATDSAYEGPAAHYYGVMAGTKHLNAVLVRAMKDRNPAVAVKAIDSLAEIVGQSNLFANNEAQPLLQAMSYPDRIVRFKAAAAIAASLPQQQFEGHQMVVPILADMIAQTGKTGVLYIARDQNELNAMTQALAKVGLTNAVGGVGVMEAFNNSARLPTVDLIYISETIPDKDVRGPAGDSMRLGAAPILPAKGAHLADPTRLASDIDAKIKSAKALPLDPDKAKEFALRSAELLRSLAINRNTVLDPAAALPIVQAGLDDTRPEIVEACASILARIKGKEIQGRLLAKGSDAAGNPKLRVAFLKALAFNAKSAGNLMDSEQTDMLRKVAETDKDGEVRSAAAEAHGACNLPPDQIKNLIVAPAAQ